MQEQKKSEPFGMKDKLGYMFGDLANDMTFIFQSMFLMLFYTDVLGIPGGAVGTLFLLARFVDAVTDVSIGRLVDTIKPARDGKFKPWIRRIAGPVAIASFLMYQTGMQDASMTVKMIYMYVTYILWGSVFYTAINIPYGSMASAITDKPSERTQLSTFRTIGATLASLVIGAVVPLVVYTTGTSGQEVVKTDATFTLLAGVFSVLAILFYILCYKMTTERVKVQPTEGDEKQSFLASLGSLVKNRSMIGIVLAALFLILAQLMIGQMNNYVYPNVYGSSAAISLINTINPVLVLIVSAPLAPILANRFGKKELGTAAMFFAAAAYGLLFFIKTDNMYVYMVFSALAYTGFGLFNSVIWANITDVIDDLEIETHDRQDGTVYSVYSFARKIGQSLAGFAGGWALSLIGYISGADVQPPEVLDGIYDVSTIVPAVSFLLAGLVLLFIYPLSKSKVENNTDTLAKRRANRK